MANVEPFKNVWIAGRAGGFYNVLTDGAVKSALDVVKGRREVLRQEKMFRLLKRMFLYGSTGIPSEDYLYRCCLSKAVYFIGDIGGVFYTVFPRRGVSCSGV